MASMNVEEHLEEQPPKKKSRIDNCQEELENASNPNDSEFTKSAEGDKDSFPTTTIVDLPPSAHRPLPLEMNCEMYKFLTVPIQCKFIWGMGRGIYAMFRQKLLTKTKRLRNPKGQGKYWQGLNKPSTVSADGSTVTNNTNERAYIFASKGFAISAEHSRADNFPGTILYYFEVKYFGKLQIGLSNSGISASSYKNFDPNPNNCAMIISPISTDGRYFTCSITLDNDYHSYWNHYDIARQHREKRDVYGCGLVLDPNDKLAIFFTYNGMLIRRKFPISPTEDRLFPAVTILPNVSSIDTNFGDDPAKPFEYDIKNCPGLGLECI